MGALPDSSMMKTVQRLRSLLLPTPLRTRLLLALLLLPELALLAYLTVGALLSFPAQSPHQADLVVVLGGGDGARYARGRDLVLAGYSQRLLLIHSTVAERDDAHTRLRGVEVRFDDLPLNSWQEAQAVRAWMDAYGWRSVLVVSDPPHLLRLRYTWGVIFQGAAWGSESGSFFNSRLIYFLISSEPPWWSAWAWWRNPQSAEFVGSEVLKMGYYIFRYQFGF